MNKKSISKYFLFLILVFLLITFTVPVFGEESGEPAAISAGDIGWILTSSALVLLMTIPGLALFYGGMVRNKNVLSTMMHSFIAVCVW